MKSFLLITASLVVSLLGFDAAAQCVSDVDCKGDRICEDGRCVSLLPPSDSRYGSTEATRILNILNANSTDEATWEQRFSSCASCEVRVRCGGVFSSDTNAPCTRVLRDMVDQIALVGADIRAQMQRAM